MHVSNTQPVSGKCPFHPTSAADKATKKRASDFKKQSPDAISAEKPADFKIMCPGLRLAQRAGAFGDKDSIYAIAKGLSDVGFLRALEGTGVATVTSAGQIWNAGFLSLFSKFGHVDLHALHDAAMVSHTDLFSANPGDTEFNPEFFAETMKSFEEKADAHGHVSYEAVVQVKQEIADRAGVEVGKASAIENKLLYSILGGNERGYIDIEDIRAFFLGEVPSHLATQYITQSTLSSLK